MNWIRCVERLPKKPGTYFCHYDATELSESCECYSYWLGDAWCYDIFPTPVPSHWYEIPTLNNETEKVTDS